MKLNEIMSRNIESVSSNASLVEASNVMARRDIGFLAVADEKISGVLTDRDIVIRAIAQGKDPSSTTAGEIATTDVEIMEETLDVADAARLMEDKQIRRILVKDGKGALVGVVSLGDLAATGHETELCGQAMEKVCAS